MSRLVVAGLAAALALSGLTGCSQKDPLTIGTPSPASPAAAPSPTVSPAGDTWPVPGATNAGDRHAEGIAVSGDRVAVGLDHPNQLAILDAHSGRPLRVVGLSAAPAHVMALPDGGFRTVAGRELVTVPKGGNESRVRLPAVGHGLAVLPDGGTAVSFRDGTIGVYDAGGAPRRTIRTRGQLDGIAAIGDRIVVVDGAATSLTGYRASTGKPEESLRAGNGALHVVAGPKRRFVVADTRDGELLVFSTGPLYLRQRYPLPGSPYGMAYDPRRQVVWVTLTARNQVVGFDLSGGAPKEIARHPTVRQPDSVAVDPVSGTVFVAGKTSGVVEAIPS
jgi:DNA-binding beta-propeller fold protein YncE